jgi:ribose 5-phosphate isomerase B
MTTVVPSASKVAVVVPCSSVPRLQERQRLRIAIGCDHVGFPFKASIIEGLEGDAHAVLDLGVHSADRVDYPAMAKAVVTALMKGFVDVGIIVCETSLGAAIAANKFTGIRAVPCHDADSARQSRVRLNANVLCLAGSDMHGDGAAAIVREWLSAAFSGDERDVRELAGIEAIAEIARQGPRGARADETVRATTPRPASTSAAEPSAPESPSAAERPAPAQPTSAEPPEPPSQAEAPSPDPIEAPARVEISPPPSDPARVADISAVLKFLASLKDESLHAMARRILQVIRNRFPAAEGTPSADGFTFTLDGKHVATVMITKKHIEVEIGPDRVPTGRIRDVDGLEGALRLPSIAKGFDAVRS